MEGGDDVGINYIVHRAEGAIIQPTGDRCVSTIQVATFWKAEANTERT